MMNLSQKWRKIIKLDIMRQSKLTSQRVAAVLKSLSYIDGNGKGHARPQPVSINSLTQAQIKQEKAYALQIMQEVNETLINELLLQPKKWSNNKFKEAQHFTADVIQYLIEDTQRIEFK